MCYRCDRSCKGKVFKGVWKHIYSECIYAAYLCNKTMILFFYVQWQMYQVNKFCQKYNESQSDVLLEDEFWTIRHKLYRHLLFNDQKKFIFCSLPKVGNNNIAIIALPSSIVHQQLWAELLTFKSKCKIA